MHEPLGAYRGVVTVKPRPIQLAIVDDYEVVVSGVAKMLERYEDRVEVVELDARRLVSERVDIAMFDTFGQGQDGMAHLQALIRTPHIGAVVVYTWNFQPDVIQMHTDAGIRGYLSKTLPAAELVAALERVQAGETVVSQDTPGGPVAGEWPGREEGLTPREAEVLALITQGLSNKDIAAQTHLSINSIKSYIRTGYRKIGVTSRSQAVLWGVRHGFEPDRRRFNADSEPRSL